MHTLDQYVSESVETVAEPRYDDVGFPPAASVASTRRQRERQKLLCKASVPLRLFGCRHHQAIGILMYHRIDDGSLSEDEMLCVSPMRFREQMQGLLAKGYEPWGLRNVIRQHTRGEKIPRNVFVVVFDDGYESVYRNAWPVLRRFRIPATIFLATAYLDRKEAFPFDTNSRRVPRATNRDAYHPLRSEQCAEMAASGLVDLGTHTHSHFDFRRRSEEFRQDLDTSLTLLRERFGIVDATFAFPYGFTASELMAPLRQMGVSCGLTTQCRLVTPQCDRYYWGRFGVSEFDTASSLAAKLDGWYSFLQDAWHQVRSPWREMRGR